MSSPNEPSGTDRSALYLWQVDLHRRFKARDHAAFLEGAFAQVRMQRPSARSDEWFTDYATSVEEGLTDRMGRLQSREAGSI